MKTYGYLMIIALVMASNYAHAKPKVTDSIVFQEGVCKGLEKSLESIHDEYLKRLYDKTCVKTDVSNNETHSKDDHVINSDRYYCLLLKGSARLINELKRFDSRKSVSMTQLILEDIDTLSGHVEIGVKLLGKKGFFCKSKEFERVTQ